MIGFEELFRREETDEHKAMVWEEINPNSDGFYDNILKYVCKTDDEVRFKSAVEYIAKYQEQRINSFLVPSLYFTCLEEEAKKDFWYHHNYEIEEILLQTGGCCDVSTAKPFLWAKRIKWRKLNLQIGDLNQYYIFLVEYVNRLVDGGLTIEKALKKILKPRKAMIRFSKVGFLCGLNSSEYVFGGNLYEWPQTDWRSALADLQVTDKCGLGEDYIILFLVIVR